MKLMITWGLKFDEEQKISFLALKDDVKENLGIQACKLQYLT